MFGIGEIIEYVKTLGLWDLVKANMRKYVFLRIRRIVLSWSVENRMPQPKAYRKFLEAVTIRKGTLADARDLHRMMKEHHLWRSVGELRQWIEKGYFLSIAVCQDKIIGYACVGAEIPRRHSIFKKAISLRPDDAYGVHAFIVPAYRGKMVYHALALDTFRRARAAGYRRIVATVDSQNLAARSSNKRLGMEEIAEVEITKVLFLTRMKTRSLKQN
ncbi:MAG: hypothetical protein AMS15_00945 [Planctomycetes bacterium DG_23]|nr:MAG: hypothetical protein AMS15_00945 [Planctomycetes bacterium DG_23]